MSLLQYPTESQAVWFENFVNLQSEMSNNCNSIFAKNVFTFLILKVITRPHIHVMTKVPNEVSMVYLALFYNSTVVKFIAKKFTY